MAKKKKDKGITRNISYLYPDDFRVDREDREGFRFKSLPRPKKEPDLDSTRDLGVVFARALKCIATRPDGSTGVNSHFPRAYWAAIEFLQGKEEPKHSRDKGVRWGVTNDCHLLDPKNPKLGAAQCDNAVSIVVLFGGMVEQLNQLVVDGYVKAEQPDEYYFILHEILSRAMLIGAEATRFGTSENPTIDRAAASGIAGQKSGHDLSKAQEAIAAARGPEIVDAVNVAIRRYTTKTLAVKAVASSLGVGIATVWRALKRYPKGTPSSR